MRSHFYQISVIYLVLCEICMERWVGMDPIVKYIYIFFVGSRLFEFRAIPNEYFPRFYSNSCCFNFCPLLLCQRQNINNWCIQLVCITFRGRRGRVRMVVGFATTYAISTYHHWCEIESRSRRGVQHYVIKFVSDLRQVCGFLWALRFPPSTI